MKGFNPAALLDKVRSLFSGFTGGQKAMTAIAVVAALVGAGLFVSWASKPTYAPLFSGLSSTDAAAVTAKLAEAKEPYQLADGGQTILVPQADVYQQRITLSGEGLPSGNGGGDGYSLLDKQSMTSSDFQQQVTYQRALEGELRKTIEAIDGVQTAVVHLAMPQEDVFTENASVPTASVLVQTSPTSPLKPAQVEAIVHLVSSSVPKLTADQVTVADSSGRVLNSGGGSGVSAHERRAGAAGAVGRGRHHDQRAEHARQARRPRPRRRAGGRRPQLRPDQGRPRGVHRGQEEPAADRLRHQGDLQGRRHPGRRRARPGQQRRAERHRDQREQLLRQAVRQPHQRRRARSRPRRPRPPGRSAG